MKSDASGESVTEGILPIFATKPHDYHHNILWPTDIQNNGVANSTIACIIHDLPEFINTDYIRGLDKTDLHYEPKYESLKYCKLVKQNGVAPHSSYHRVEFVCYRQPISKEYLPHQSASSTVRFRFDSV